MHNQIWVMIVYSNIVYALIPMQMWLYCRRRGGAPPGPLSGLQVGGPGLVLFVVCARIGIFKNNWLCLLVLSVDCVDSMGIEY